MFSLLLLLLLYSFRLILIDKEEQQDVKVGAHLMHNIGNGPRNQYPMDMNNLLSMSPPPMEEEINVGGMENVHHETVIADNAEESPFKKPLDAHYRPAGSSHSHSGHPHVDSENIGRPTREILSCIMTTTGFISPAREGKLPDARKPVNIPDDPPSPPPPSAKSSTAAESATTEKKSAKNSSGAGKGDNSSLDPSSAPSALSGSSSSKKLLLAGVPKQKNQNKKRKLMTIMSKERKKAKKEMRMQHGEDSAAPFTSPTSKSKHAIHSLALPLPPADNIPHSVHDLQTIDPSIVPHMDAKQKGQSIENMTTPKTKKIKKKGEGKHKTPQVQTTPDMAQSATKQPRKKRTPKISKKALAAAALAGQMPLESFVGDPHGHPLYAGSKFGHIPDTPPFGTVKDSTPLQQVGLPDPNPFKFTDPASNMAYDSPEMNPYSHPAAYKNSDKLSNEPDKRKLNIFKKISSSSAAGSSDQSNFAHMLLTNRFSKILVHFSSWKWQ